MTYGILQLEGHSHNSQKEKTLALLKAPTGHAGALRLSDKNLEEIKKIIDTMQSGLVELFDQLHELRRQLDLAGADFESSPSISPAPATPKAPAATKKEETNESSSATSIPPDELADIPLTNENVSIVLDPITQELQTGEAPAQVIAEYLEAAKEYLIQEHSANEKVVRDIDVVLKFLQARGKKGIRPEERDNILERIRRWKVHLTA